MLELLKNAISKVFSTIKDIACILEISADELENLSQQTTAVENDVFIQKCGSERLKEYEDLCGLTARVNLNVAQRRQDVLITFASNVPYTLPKLKDFLNTILGIGNWELIINYNAYKINVRLKKPTEAGVDSLLRGLREMLPCHIEYYIGSDVFINNENAGHYQGGYIENKYTYNLKQAGV